MSNTLGIKLFLSYLFLSLGLLGASFYFYSNHIVNKQKDLYLEILAERAQGKVAQFHADLDQKKAKHFALKKDYNLLFKKPDNSLQLLGPYQEEFNPRDFRNSIGSSATNLFPCESKNEKYWCSVSSTKLEGVWLFDRIPVKSIEFASLQTFWTSAQVFFALLLVSFILSFIFTKLLLSPYVDRQIRRREQNLRKQSIQLIQSEKLASLGQLGASIAHEIKNPLMAMKGYAGFLLKKMGDDPDLKEAATIIRDESERCSQILQQILRYSRSSTSEKKAYSVSELLSNIQLLVKSEARQRQIELKIEIKNDVVGFGNPQQTQQVILNLLINAFHVSPPNSKVQLQLLVHSDSDDFFRIRILDEGIGIPREVQSHIFDPFFSTKNPGESSGLGLSIAKQIVETQGGEIRLASSDESGSCFEIDLPLAKQDKD